jgi:hypothetical protein
MARCTCAGDGAAARALLPINIYRALEMAWLTRRVSEATAQGDLSAVWLEAVHEQRAHRGRPDLFRAGDKADFLYFLAEGRIEFVEIGEVMEPGRLFGEIAFFAPDKRRSMTARCVTAAPCCTSTRRRSSSFTTRTLRSASRWCRWWRGG